MAEGHIESSAVEVDGVDEVLLIAETASRRLFKAHARAVFRSLSRRARNARPASTEKLAGCRSQSYFVPLKRSSPAARRRLFSARRT